ncbi:alpha-isopropylmalate synthase regulatory domain-containing protein [Chondrinema litorale]|uniref:alpha-isopropylmalate synthase regulatory domain-containing protein n=1 Tax=Chondrinema litorale TaxID=2994555 RepID=UPI002543A4E1|nr:alpha-isopropylmalate synthase regulatory domain-containing protein [Chondrinema litorale]UZR95843.1 2-isopropylmalate synthase [Chondrinema litorale]
MKVEVMDTTLRDGEQTSGVAFSPTEKLNIAKILLEEVKVDRLEVASARISEGEFEGVKKIVSWAEEKGFLNQIEVLGFIDGTKSLDWMQNAGAKVINLLSKGSLNHLEGQLRKTKEAHLADIRRSLDYAEKLGISVNLYMEDWSNGMKNSPDYVFYMLSELQHENIKRFMLPDTLGVLNPFECNRFFKNIIKEFPNLHFDCHTHNDYDLAVANVMAALDAGAKGVHTTVNGLGERSGNAPLASVVALAHDQMGMETRIDEKKLNKVSRMVEVFSGTRIPSNKPIVGEHVFTQTCGVHADGDSKGNLYFNDLTPERFGRLRKYALGKTSGKASIRKNLEELGIELSPDTMEKVTKKVVELGDKKEGITTEDLPYIISDVMGSEIIKEKIKIHNYFVTHVFNLKPNATLSIEIEGEYYEETSIGDGQYDAFMKALKKIYKRLDKNIATLIDYAVTIPPGGKTNALVETVIKWTFDNREFKTRGLDSDQTSAAIQATMKMLNLIERE